MAPIPLIIGSGRSGTTWIQDVLAHANGYRTAFEPLHPSAIVKMKPYAGRYMRANERNTALQVYLQEVFEGRSRNLWVNYRVRPDRIKPTVQMLKSPRKAYEWTRRVRKLIRHYRRYSRDRHKPVLTKFIRANLMYNWLLTNFDVRLLVVVRHPGAVIESKLRLGGEDWDPVTTINHYLQQADLVDDQLARISGMDIGNLGPEAQHALIWCIENAALLMNVNKDSKALVSFYEKLVIDHDHEWERVCRHLGFANIPTLESRQLASQQARPERASGSYRAEELDKWSGQFSVAAAEEVQNVLDTFGINVYRMDSALPAPVALKT